MPYVNIRVTRENGTPTAEQKAELIKGATELLVRVLGKNPATTVVVRAPEMATGTTGTPVLMAMRKAPALNSPAPPSSAKARSWKPPPRWCAAAT